MTTIDKDMAITAYTLVTTSDLNLSEIATTLQVEPSAVRELVGAYVCEQHDATGLWGFGVAYDESRGES